MTFKPSPRKNHFPLALTQGSILYTGTNYQQSAPLDVEYRNFLLCLPSCGG